MINTPEEASKFLSSMLENLQRGATAYALHPSLRTAAILTMSAVQVTQATLINATFTARPEVSLAFGVAVQHLQCEIADMLGKVQALDRESAQPVDRKDVQ